MFTSKRSVATILSAMIALIAPLLTVPSADAAQTLAQVQARVRQLEEEATTAAEGAQEAKVKLASLNGQLQGIQARAAVQSQSVAALSKSLNAIAVEQFKTGGLSQSLELLFSADPALYLSAAGSLEAITRKKSVELRKFQAAKQRLTATSLTVSDKLALVKATQKKLAAQSARATAKLAEAESLLSKLKKEDRERLARLAQEEEDADQASSLAAAKKAVGVSGRAGKALQFALKQIGDKYVFGADGMTYWDCSGLTMRAFQTAGVSLPHSSRAQFNYGKSVKRSNLAAGDLVFFAATIPHVEAAEVAGREAATGAHETDALAVAEFRDLQVDVEDRGSAGRETAPRTTEGDGDGEVGEVPRLPGLGRTGDDHLGALEQNALDELRRIRLVLGAEGGRGDDVAGVLVRGFPIGERSRAEIDGEEALHALAAQTAGAAGEARGVLVGLVDLEAG